MLLEAMDRAVVVALVAMVLLAASPAVRSHMQVAVVVVLTRVHPALLTLAVLAALAGAVMVDR
jgi:hypothetical protein